MKNYEFTNSHIDPSVEHSVDHKILSGSSKEGKYRRRISKSGAGVNCSRKKTKEGIMDIVLQIARGVVIYMVLGAVYAKAWISIVGVKNGQWDDMLGSSGGHGDYIPVLTGRKVDKYDTPHGKSVKSVIRWSIYAWPFIAIIGICKTIGCFVLYLLRECDAFFIGRIVPQPKKKEIPDPDYVKAIQELDEELDEIQLAAALDEPNWPEDETPTLSGGTYVGNRFFANKAKENERKAEKVIADINRELDERVQLKYDVEKWIGNEFVSTGTTKKMIKAEIQAFAEKYRLTGWGVIALMEREGVLDDE